MLDLADRWTSKEDCRNKSPKDYRFQGGQNGWDEATSLRAAIYLAQATEHAKHLAKQRLDLNTSASSTLGPQAT
eukprot:4657138-Lingulodinium_polyedra.AAC.1